jgi:hypothetical protein
MIERIKKFWIDSYKTNIIAFYYEMISAVTVIIGSAILTYTVLAPRPDIFIPFYWIGSITGMVGAYYRMSSWILVLTMWFTMMNTIAMWRLFL